MFSYASALELEAHGKLHLTFTEDRAAGSIRCLERTLLGEHSSIRSAGERHAGHTVNGTGCVGSETRTSRGRTDAVVRVVLASHLSSVEDVETFHQNLERRIFREPEPS